MALGKIAICFGLSISFFSLHAVIVDNPVRKLGLYWSTYERALSGKDANRQIQIYLHSHDIDLSKVFTQSLELMAHTNPSEQEKGRCALDRLVQLKFVPALGHKAHLLVTSDQSHKNLDQAIVLLTQMKELKDGQAAYRYLGNIYMNSPELGDYQQRLEQAQSFYAQGCEKDDPDCLYMHGLHCVYTGDVDKGCDLLDKAVEDHKHLPSQIFLGQFYGNKATPDYYPLLAQHYFSKAYFAHNDPYAATEVGRILLSGDITHDDDGNEILPGVLDPVGESWLSCASDKGSIFATQLLETRYAHKDRKKARDYALKALRQGVGCGYFCPPLHSQSSLRAYPKIPTSLKL